MNHLMAETLPMPDLGMPDAPEIGASWNSMAENQVPSVTQVENPRHWYDRFKAPLAAIASAAAVVGPLAPAAGAKVEGPASSNAKAANVIQWQTVYATCQGGPVKPADGPGGYKDYFQQQENRINAWAKAKIGKTFNFSPNVQTLQIPPSFVDSSGNTVDTSCSGLNSARMGTPNTYYALEKMWLNNKFGSSDYVLLDLQNSMTVGKTTRCGYASPGQNLPSNFSHLVVSTVEDSACSAGPDDSPIVPPNGLKIDGDAVTTVFMLEQLTPVVSPSATSKSSNIIEQDPIDTSWAGYRMPFNALTIDATSANQVSQYMETPVTPPPPTSKLHLTVKRVGPAKTAGLTVTGPGIKCSNTVHDCGQDYYVKTTAGVGTEKVSLNERITASTTNKNYSPRFTNCAGHVVKLANNGVACIEPVKAATTLMATATLKKK